MLHLLDSSTIRLPLIPRILPLVLPGPLENTYLALNLRSQEQIEFFLGALLSGLLEKPLRPLLDNLVSDLDFHFSLFCDSRKVFHVHVPREDIVVRLEDLACEFSNDRYSLLLLRIVD